MEGVRQNRIDHAQEAIDLIDRTLAEPPVSIYEAIKHAIAKGRMSAEEGEECLEAYERSFQATERPAAVTVPYDSEGTYLEREP